MLIRATQWNGDSSPNLINTGTIHYYRVFHKLTLKENYDSRYTRNLVDEGNGKFNLMILCWGEGHGSAVHDHADAHCFMKILQGSLAEVRFEWPENESDEGLKEISRNVLNENDICYINGQFKIKLIAGNRTERLFYDRFVGASSCRESESHIFRRESPSLLPPVQLL